MSAGVTVLCPGCGGDWTLERPRSADVVAEVECECGALLRLSLDGRLTALTAEGRRPVAPVERDEAGPPPRAVGELLLEVFRALEKNYAGRP